MLDLASSVVPYFLLTAAMYVLVPVSPVLVLALAVPAAGFTLRTYTHLVPSSHERPGRPSTRCSGGLVPMTA